VVTAFLSNDATALILTPVVALAAQRAGVDPVPYALATSYVADAASALLPVANPVNILTIDATHVALGGYLRVLLLPAVLVALTTVAAIALLLRGRLDPLRAATPRATMSPLVRPATLVLAGVAGAYVAATALRVPAARSRQRVPSRWPRWSAGDHRRVYGGCALMCRGRCSSSWRASSSSCRASRTPASPLRCCTGGLTASRDREPPRWQPLPAPPSAAT
jgi:hypothetical protein